MLHSRRDRIESFAQFIAHRRPPVFLWAVSCWLFATTALAQTGSGDHGQDVSPSPAPKVESLLDLEQRFLRVESPTWASFGFRLSKNGQAVGPGFFSVVPDDAVTGSKEAMVHARHARVYQGFTLGSALAGVGLIVGGFAVAGHHEGWTQTARLITARWDSGDLHRVFLRLGQGTRNHQDGERLQLRPRARTPRKLSDPEPFPSSYPEAPRARLPVPAHQPNTRLTCPTERTRPMVPCRWSRRYLTSGFGPSCVPQPRFRNSNSRTSSQAAFRRR
jgi:hypothetical protein